MKARGKKLLAAMLSLAMVLSMFVVPASAADLTGALNDEWVFYGGADFVEATYAYGSNTAGLNFKGVTISAGAGYHNGYCYMNNGHTVTIPVAGQCDVKVYTYANPAGSVGVGSDTETLSGTCTIYHYAPETDGEVVIATTATTYLEKIVIATYTAPEEPEEPTSATPLGAGPRNVSNTGTNAHVDGAIVWEDGKWNFNGDHGPQSKGDDSTVTLLLAKPEEGKVVDVTFETCAAYGSQGNVTVTGPEGSTAGAATVVETGAMRSDGDTAAYAVKVSGIEVTEAEAGKGQEVTFTVKGSTYVHGFTVAHVEKATTPDPEPSATVAAGTYYFSDYLHQGKKYSQVEGAEKKGATDVAGVTFTGFSGTNPHGPQASNGGTVTVSIPTDKYSTLVVTTCGYGAADPLTSVSSTTSVTKKTLSDCNSGGMEYTISNAKGETVITFTGNTYIHGITVGEFTDQPVDLSPSLKLPKTAVDLKVGGEAATVTPEVEHLANAEVDAVSGNEAVATASCDNGVVTIAPVGKGETTVTVSATGDGLDEALTKTISIFVWDPAEPLTEWNFRIPAYLETSPSDYRGLVLTNVKKKDSNYGTQAKGGTYGIPVPGPCTITVSVGYNWDVYMSEAKEHNTAETSYKDNTNSGDIGVTFDYEGEAGTVTLATGTEFTSYVKAIKVEAAEPIPDPEPGNGKVDVYDFGAEKLDTAKFNNRLTVDAINAWYPGVAPGSKDKALPSTATTGMFTYAVSGGGDRLRTSNTALTRFDETNNRCDLAAGQDPYEPNRTSYTGVICSNGGTVTLKMVAGAGDKITYIMGSNAGTAYTTTFTGADGSTKEAEVPAAHGAVTFYAPETGRQSLFSGVENGNRPAVARIYVEQPTAVEVSGTLTIDESLADATGLKLVFTNDDSGIATEATITGGTYTVSLNNYQSGTSYTVTAKGITGSVVKVGKALAFTKDTADTATHNITAGRVALVDVSGRVTGMDAASLNRLKLTLTPPEGEIYVPEITLSQVEGAAWFAWSAQLQSGIEYAVTAENVNDYTLDTTTVKKNADATDAAIAFTAKPTHAVTIVPTGLTLAELADAAFTFTNVSETYAGANGKPVKYAYTFTGPGAIALRDGQYKVEVDTTKGRQELTPDLKVRGAAVNCPVGFDVSVPTEWNFRSGSALLGTANGVAFNGTSGTAWGLVIDGTSGKFDTKNRSDWAQVNAGTKISVPVSAEDGKTVTLTVNCYNGSAFTIGGTANNKAQANEDFTCTVTNGAVEIVCTLDSYIGYIKVTVPDNVEFKDTVTVGEGKDCATITEALELVAKMPRSGERVTILIDPGDYEEQLLVEVPNVTLKNAKAAEAKLELKDKGVGIGDNEVRITHYYGHGYTYYSMTDGHRYNEKVLAVNKQNGYPSFINKGAGSDGNSYWNASVVVKADGFQAEGIIFENSFNQYVSAKATKDVIVPQAGAAKEGATPRAELPEGSTTVQEKAYVERATALAMDGADEAFFENCAFIGRQDVVYGGVGTTAAFYDCDVYGGTDYIFGGMNAVFAKCDLVLNTSEHKNDVAYITAGQQNSGGRGYLMYNCSVISTVPGVNTASKLPSKPGTFGRAWSANCEVVFYETIVDSTTTKADGTEGTQEVSLIQPIGWKDGLGGNFDRCAEYHTHEIEGTVPARLAPAQVLDTPVLSDSTAIDYETWLGGWKPFEGKDMTVLGCPDTSHTITFRVDTGAKVADLAADGKPETLNSKSQLLALKEAVVTFKIDVAEGYTLTKVTGATWDDQRVYTVNADTVVISVRSPGGSSDMVPTGPSGGSGKGETVTNPDGSKTTTVTDRKGNTTVTTVAVDGSKVEKLTTKAGDKTVTVTDAKGEVQVKIELPAVIPAPETKFADVPEGHWAEKAVNDMAGLGLVKGVSDNSFDMDSPITRGSVATILFRLSNGAEGKTSGFTDVKAGDWYADAVAWAAGTGVVTGYSETIFAPNDSITREQFAVMLYRFARLINMDTTASGEVSAFSDAGSVAAWAGDAMTWCVGAGILNGVSDPVQGITLSPAKTASRAECAVMLGRFIALI